MTSSGVGRRVTPWILPVLAGNIEPVEQTGRLDVLKALGDNTRYAIYLELARSAAPRSTAEVAETLGLHANTVRPHLERMREVGLDRKSTRLNSSHIQKSRMPSSA